MPDDDTYYGAGFSTYYTLMKHHQDLSPEFTESLLHLVFGTKKLEFDAGHDIALDEVVLLCFQLGKSFPDWAEEALKKRSLDNINGPPPRRGGRHSKPRTKQKDRVRKAFILAALREAKRQGFRGEGQIAITEGILDLLGIDYRKEAVRRHVTVANKPIPGHMVGDVFVGASLCAAMAFKETSPAHWDKLLAATRNPIKPGGV